MFRLLAAGAVLLRPLGPHHGRFPSAFDNPLFRLLSQPWFWGALGLIVGPCLLFRGLQMLRLKRLVEDTPRSTVRAAAIGNVELTGAACGPYVLAAPLSKQDCFYYRLIVWVRRDNRRQRIVEEKFVPLFLDDGTGHVLVDPRRARLYFESTTGGPADSLGDLVARHGPYDEIEEIREFCIAPGAKLFAFGALRDNPWMQDETGDPYVSAEEADFLRHEIFPTLDPTVPSGAVLDGAECFNVRPPVVLMMGAGPFVLSHSSYREVVEGLAWKSSALIAGGVVWFVVGVWQVVSRLS